MKNLFDFSFTLWPIIFSTLLISCEQKDNNILTNTLIGVWSGLLFQTESKFDSLVLSPFHAPQEATLYWKNHNPETYQLNRIGNNISFKENGVRFDGKITQNGQIISGLITHNLWVQSLDFKLSNNNWVAKIPKPEIIDTDYLVFLEFYKDALGNIQSKIQSNKENRELHFKIEKVRINNNDINFDITNERFSLSAQYLPRKNKIQLTYGNTGGKRKFQLQKLDINKLTGYVPKINASQYKYKTPNLKNESLESTSLTKVGINPSITNLVKAMQSGKYDHIHSIIISKNKKIVFEEYFHGYEREYLHDIRSAFKSVAALMMTQIIDSGLVKNVQEPVLNYYPEYEIRDKAKNAITIHHALTMSSGLQLEDEDEMQWKNKDWVKYKLNMPLVRTPGEKFEYSSGGMNLLSGIIEQSTFQYLPQYLYSNILIPMNIKKFQMLTSPVGRGYLAGNFYLRPIDFTKFGILFLNDGKWGNKQIISKKWIENISEQHIKINYPKNAHYGYLWRVINRNIQGKNFKSIEAWGNGGQFLIIIPDLELTITFTGGNYNLFPEMENKPFEILNKYIFPSININY